MTLHRLRGRVCFCVSGPLSTPSTPREEYPFQSVRLPSLLPLSLLTVMHAFQFGLIVYLTFCRFVFWLQCCLVRSALSRSPLAVSRRLPRCLSTRTLVSSARLVTVYPAFSHTFFVLFSIV
jgi:hypothetical protein